MLIDNCVLAKLLRHAHSYVVPTQPGPNVQQALNGVVAAAQAVAGRSVILLQVDVIKTSNGRITHSAAVGDASDIGSASTHVTTTHPPLDAACAFTWTASVRGTPPEHRATPAKDQTVYAALTLMAEHLTPIVADMIEVLSLREALLNRDTFGIAKGMLMERNGIDAASAFNLIARISQGSNVKAATIAHRVIAAGPT